MAAEDEIGIRRRAARTVDAELDAGFDAYLIKPVDPETLKRLGKDDDSSVREAARANPGYPRFSLVRALFGG